MNDIYVFFIGGTSEWLSNVDDATTERFLRWYKDSNSSNIFTGNINTYSETAYIKKDFITHVKVVKRK